MAKLFILFPAFFYLFFSAEIQDPDFICLRLENERTHKVLLEIAVKPGDLFLYHYMHSSDHTPVRDTFRVEKAGKLILIEEAYLWYGAGLEFRDHQEAKVNYTDSWTTVRLQRAFQKLPIRVGRVARQTLSVHGIVYCLQKLANPGDPLILFLTLKAKDGEGKLEF